MTRRRNIVCITDFCCNFIVPNSRKRCCSDECRVFHRSNNVLCEGDGCNNRSSLSRGRYCERCYMRNYRYKKKKKWKCLLCENLIDRDRSKNKQTCSEECRKLHRKLVYYNISIDQYFEYINQYGKKCYICGHTQVIHIDHCHSTGRFRGILCRNHNVALGLFSDSVDDLISAAQYLKDRGA